MVVVSKFFKDITDGLTPYKKGVKATFTTERESYLIAKGFAVPFVARNKKKSVTEE